MCESGDLTVESFLAIDLDTQLSGIDDARKSYWDSLLKLKKDAEENGNGERAHITI